MVKTEILQELEDNVVELKVLINKQKFDVGDADKFLARYGNIYLKMERLEKSRNLWMEKCKKLKEEKSN